MLPASAARCLERAGVSLVHFSAESARAMQVRLLCRTVPCAADTGNPGGSLTLPLSDCSLTAVKDVSENQRSHVDLGSFANIVPAASGLKAGVRRHVRGQEAADYARTRRGSGRRAGIRTGSHGLALRLEALQLKGTCVV